MFLGVIMLNLSILTKYNQTHLVATLIIKKSIEYLEVNLLNRIWCYILVSTMCVA